MAPKRPDGQFVQRLHLIHPIGQGHVASRRCNFYLVKLSAGHDCVPLKLVWAQCIVLLIGTPAKLEHRACCFVCCCRRDRGTGVAAGAVLVFAVATGVWFWLAVRRRILFGRCCCCVRLCSCKGVYLLRLCGSGRSLAHLPVPRLQSTTTTKQLKEIHDTRAES